MIDIDRYLGKYKIHYGQLYSSMLYVMMLLRIYMFYIDLIHTYYSYRDWKNNQIL